MAKELRERREHAPARGGSALKTGARGADTTAVSETTLDRSGPRPRPGERDVPPPGAPASNGAAAERRAETAGLRVVVFTTSYPRDESDCSGRFVFSTVQRLRERGLEIEVVRPGVYRDYGLTATTGGGVVANLKRRPWVAPLVFLSMVRALHRAARTADLVHANWLGGALVAAMCAKPFVATLHGSPSAGPLEDLELARRAPWLVRLVLARARAVISCSERLAEAIRGCGLESGVAIPYGVDLPADIGDRAAAPAVLYVGRLAAEKNIDTIAEATSGLNRIVAGDGPLRELLPDTIGFVPPTEVPELYARSAVVVVASQSEGLPNVVLEAMAHGKAVVATPVGGIPAVIEDGKTGFLVPPRDAPALRAAIERLLADEELRRRLGSAARERVAALCSWDRVIDATLEVYRRSARPRDRRPAAGCRRYRASR